MKKHVVNPDSFPHIELWLDSPLYLVFENPKNPKVRKIVLNFVANISLDTTSHDQNTRFVHKYEIIKSEVNESRCSFPSYNALSIETTAIHDKDDEETLGFIRCRGED